MPIQAVDRLFIDGEFARPHGTDQLALENPATGEVITQVTLADAVDTHRAIDAAGHAFAMYQRGSLATRQVYLRRIHDAMTSRLDRLLETVNAEYGAPQSFAKYALHSTMPPDIGCWRGKR